jgi:hypothetical protein
LELTYKPFWKADWLKLIPILALAFYVSFIPHLDYPYPVHGDEWIHMAQAKAMIGAHPATLNLSSNLEAGYHILLAFIQQISGISWEILFRFFPAVFSLLTVLSVYLLAKKHDFGWEAAFLIAVIPTTVGVLGSALLVPVALGLVFTPLSFFIIFRFHSWVVYLILFLFSIFLLAIHPPSAVCLLLMLLPYIIMNLKHNFKNSAGIFLALALPFFAVLPWITDLLLPTAQSLLEPSSPLQFEAAITYHSFPDLIISYGYIPTALCLLGVFWLYMKGGKEKVGIVLALLILLIMELVYFTFHYGVPILYARGLVFALLMIGIVAGAGLTAVKRLKLPVRKASNTKPGFVLYLGPLLCAVLVIAVLVLAIPARRDYNYYHYIDQEDYNAFNWIQENIPADYSRVVLDPWKTVAFKALTFKIESDWQFSTITAPGDFWKNGCSDTAFLKKYDVFIVYTRGLVSNQDLIQVCPNIYLRKGE